MWASDQEPLGFRPAINSRPNSKGRPTSSQVTSSASVGGQPNGAVSPANTTKASVEITLKKKALVKYILLQEYIRLGQRVKEFSVDAWKDGAWQEIASATTIGYKRILNIDPVETGKIRINIKESKACPVLSAIEVY